MKIKKEMVKCVLIFIIFIVLLFTIISIDYLLSGSNNSINDRQESNLVEEVNDEKPEKEETTLIEKDENSNKKAETNTIDKEETVEDNSSKQESNTTENEEETKPNQNNSKVEETKPNQNNSKVEETNTIDKEENVVDNSSKQESSTTEKKEPTTEQTTELKPWEKIGVSEYDYYHSPMWKWQKVDFVFNGTGENGCISMEDCNKKCDAYGVEYQLTHNGTFYCDEVYSYSGNYLGEYFKFIES